MISFWISVVPPKHHRTSRGRKRANRVTPVAKVTSIAPSRGGIQGATKPRDISDAQAMAFPASTRRAVPCCENYT
jgi:hypothetical protein